MDIFFFLRILAFVWDLHRGQAEDSFKPCWIKLNGLSSCRGFFTFSKDPVIMIWLVSVKGKRERERKENFVPLKEERLEGFFFFSCNACEVNEMSRNVGFLSGIGWKAFVGALYTLFHPDVQGMSFIIGNSNVSPWWSWVQTSTRHHLRYLQPPFIKLKQKWH